MIEKINELSGVNLKILREDDYIITNKDQGETLFGCIHEEDILEHFLIREEKAYRDKSKIFIHNDDHRNYYYANEDVDNDYTILIIGDSYIHAYILDDIAESFKETVFYMGDYLKDLPKLLEHYVPDFVIFEEAERVDRTTLIMDLAGIVGDH